MEPNVLKPLDRYRPQIPASSLRKSFFLRATFILLLVLFIIVATMISVLRSDQFQFTKVDVYGVQTFAASDVQSFGSQYLSGMQFRVVPKSSTILFSKERFEHVLKSEFPIIDIAYITFPNPATIDIHIQEKQPVAMWCFMIDNCAFVDSQGIVYSQAPSFSEGVYPIFTSEEPKTFTDMKGRQIIDPMVMNRFITLFQSLQSDDVSLSKTTFLNNGDISFSIEKLFEEYPTDHAQLLGTITQDDTVFGRDMITGLSNNAFKDQFVSNPKSLEYIDLRFPGKVFYKFTGQEKSL
jgi:hypothetical protein